ncbi:hypothetical protein QQ045_026681 [Rhodiola kirilowii]
MWAEKAHNNPLLNFDLKLKRLRRVLCKWNWRHFGDGNQIVKQLTNKVAELEIQIQNGRSVSRVIVAEAKEELSNDLRYQYAMLEEKSKNKGIFEGDQNSTFFHASIKARRIQNRICLQLDDGMYTEDGDAIGNKFVSYFQNLFGSFPNTDDTRVEEVIRSQISASQNTHLIRILDEQEVKSAVTNMNPASSPGPDGYTGKFFQSCWNIIKDDLVATVKGFFAGLQIPNLISGAHITLLPKVKNANSIDQVRPISLCNFIHKILSRILNDRLKEVLPGLISRE